MIFLDHPRALFTMTLALLWIASLFGAYLRKHYVPHQTVDEDHFNLVLGAALTLLSLITGFTFSMAVSRYDQRKDYEEQEANTIGTEYARLDVLPVADAVKVRAFLREYLNQRITYYSTTDADLLHQSRNKTSQLQSELWSAVAAPAAVQPSPLSALVISGMNDVLNSEGYTEAAWRNRVPLAAWTLLICLATFCNLLLGYRAYGTTSILFLVLPIVLAVSFFLIADIDSPRSGLIHVHAQNLESLAYSLRPH